MNAIAVERPVVVPPSRRRGGLATAVDAADTDGAAADAADIAVGFGAASSLVGPAQATPPRSAAGREAGVTPLTVGTPEQARAVDGTCAVRLAPVVALDAYKSTPSCEPGRSVEARRPPARAGVRLTRRGRLVRTLATFAVAAVVVLMILARWGSAPAPGVDHATTVLPGQTLSDIAHEQLPHLPLSDAVAAVQVANNLNSTQVVAGQSLLIPPA